MTWPKLTVLEVKKQVPAVNCHQLGEGKNQIVKPHSYRPVLSFISSSSKYWTKINGIDVHLTLYVVISVDKV